LSRFALFGASGAIGKSLVEALRSRQIPYRVVGRSEASLKEYASDPLAETVIWNPDEAESVRSAARGVDTLIYLVGVPYHQFQLHPQLMRKTIAGATAERVKRVVLAGTVYPYGRPQTEFVREEHPRNPHTFKGKMRKEQEDVLFDAHRRGDIQATILRLPDFYGPGVDKSFLHGCFRAAKKGGTANMIGPIETPHEFVFVPDAGPVILDLAEKNEAYGKWWNFAGPGAVTQRQMAEQIFRTAGKPLKIRVAGRTMLRLLGLFNPLMRELVEMHYLMTTPVLMDDSALRDLLGNVKKTSYNEGIRLTLDATQ
jgi:nucleoside-diphosphate-sugar epimerase